MRLHSLSTDRYFVNFRLIVLLFVLSLPTWVPTAYRRSTHAFRPAKCQIEWPFVAEWETPPLEDPELLSVLQAPFTYLAKGAQSYVFLSENGQYVLKLFRYDTCRMPLGRIFATKICHWTGMKPKHFVPAVEKIPFTFNSCLLAYKLAQKQTGLAYVHLNPKEGLPILNLVDRLGRKHQIDPAHYRFALQHKAEILDGRSEEVTHSFYQLLNELGEKGLVNTDPKLRRNFGSLNGRVVVIDFGNLIYNPDQAKEQVALFEKKLHKWKEKHALL